jgi:hypothetical protein
LTRIVAGSRINFEVSSRASWGIVALKSATCMTYRNSDWLTRKSEWLPEAHLSILGQATRENLINLILETAV